MRCGSSGTRACHVRARRYVYEAREYHPLEAAQLLAWYQQLYDVEDQARGKSADEVLALRREKSAPLMDKLRQWLDGDAARSVLPKSRLGKAIRYLDNQWDALCVFLTDGRVPFDNNETEPLMKQVATGRKNWLFIGSVGACYRASILLTIVSTAHRHHLDVWLYPKDVLDRLLAGERDLDALRADRWAKAHPEALRPHRIQEARYRADAKADRRAHRREVEQQGSSRQYPTRPRLHPDPERQRTCLWCAITFVQRQTGHRGVASPGTRLRIDSFPFKGRCAPLHRFHHFLEQEGMVSRLDPQDEVHAVSPQILDMRAVGGQTVCDRDESQVRMVLADAGQEPPRGVAFAVVPGLAVLADDRFGTQRGRAKPPRPDRRAGKVMSAG